MPVRPWIAHLEQRLPSGAAPSPGHTVVAADGELIWCRSFEVPAQTGAEALLAHVRRLSTITHTNLVPILGAEIVGQEIRVYFEHDGGRSLAEIMPAAGMSAPQAVAIGLSVLSGLQALQTAGFAHGALDARSVQVASYGQIRLIDYGMRPRLIPGGPPAWGDPRRDVSAAGAILCAALGIDAVRPAGTVPGTLERTMPGLAATALTIASGSAGRSASTGLMMLSDGAGRLAARSRVYLSIAELGRLATTQSPALAAAVDAIVNPASPATLPAAGGEATAAQEIEAQEIEAQEIEAQEIEAQEIKDQEIKTQEIKAQEIKAQELRAQELRAQELRAQELRAQELRAQELRAQELRAQELRAQELRAQELRAQELRAQELRAQEQEAREQRAATIAAASAAAVAATAAAAAAARAARPERATVSDATLPRSATTPNANVNAAREADESRGPRLPLLMPSRRTRLLMPGLIAAAGVILLLISAGPLLARTLHPSAPVAKTNRPAPTARATQAPVSGSVGGATAGVAPASQPTAEQPAPPAVDNPVPATAVPPSSAVAGSPQAAVSSFYSAALQHRFDQAVALWSDRMRANYPPQSNINERFAGTTVLNVNQARVTSSGGGAATVYVDLSEITYGVNYHWIGTWHLVQTSSGWLLDQPDFQPA